MSKTVITASDTHLKTLIIGDSLIRDISERGLNNVIVKCLPGARIKDVRREVVRTCHHMRGLKNVILHVGTNNCVSLKRLERAESDYRRLLRYLGEALPRVTVAVSTVCPRTDIPDYQVRVNQLNRTIREIASEEGCVVIDNDNNFKMKDDSADPSCLDKSGLYLTQAGTVRLLRNFQRAVPIIMQLNGTNKTKTPETKTNGTHAVKKTNDNHRVRHRSTSRPRSLYISRHRCRGDTDRYPIVDGACKYCGERNHPAQRCKFEEPLVCHNCFGLGHKSWMCTVRRKIRPRRVRPVY